MKRYLPLLLFFSFFLFACQKGLNEMSGEIRLLVISNYGQNTEIISEDPSHETIKNTMQNLNWQGFHQVVLEKKNGDWLEVGGSLNPSDGLSVMYEENGNQHVIKVPPTTIDEMTYFLLDYLDGSSDWKINHDWH